MSNEERTIIKRPSKTIKLNVNDNWNVSFGTNNKKNPKTVFLTFKTWITPLEDDFLEDFKRIDNKVRHFHITDNPRPYKFQSRVISTCSIADTKMIKGKPSMMKITLHMIQKECESFDSLYEDAITIALQMINGIEYGNIELFNFDRKKP